MRSGVAAFWGMLLLMAGGSAAAQSRKPPPAPFPALPSAAEVTAARAAARPVPAAEIIPPLSPIRFALQPELGDAVPELRARLEERGDAVVAEPAEWQLRVVPDFPQTLVLDKADTPTPTEIVRQTNRERLATMGPWAQELGNLVLGDYEQLLDAAIGRIARSRRLIALGSLFPGRPATTTCFTQRPEHAGSSFCDIGAGMRQVGDDSVPLAKQAPIVFAVRNETREPRYLSLLAIDPRYNHQLVPLGTGEATPPGQWATTGEPVGLVAGDTVLVTLSSRTPVDPALIGGRDAPDPTGPACTDPVAAILCGKGGTPDGSWSATATYTSIPGYSVVAVGHGLPVETATAPWMAELYSTVPYVEADFAADDAKPPAERQYLRAREGPGLAHRCGGTMIAPDLMLTAAHCVAKGGYAGAGAVRVFKERRVRVGTTELGQGGRTYAIDGMVVHAGYISGRQRRDIALLHLKLDAAADVLPKSTALLPSAVRNFRLNAGDPVTVYGWGFTGMVEPGANAFISAGEVQQNPDTLQYGEMETLKPSTCESRVGKGRLDIGMLCASTRTRGAIRLRPGLSVFSCVGDSGGPLMRESARGPVLVGIVSWAEGCGAGDNPSVYTNVEKFGKWLAAARAAIRPGQVVLIDDRGSAQPLPAATAAPVP